MSRDKPQTIAVLTRIEQTAWQEVRRTAGALKARMSAIDPDKLKRADIGLEFASDCHILSECLAQWRRADAALIARRSRKPSPRRSRGR